VNPSWVLPRKKLVTFKYRVLGWKIKTNDITEKLHDLRKKENISWRNNENSFKLGRPVNCSQIVSSEGMYICNDMSIIDNNVASHYFAGLPYFTWHNKLNGKNISKWPQN
jgi:hypothetical protein